MSRCTELQCLYKGALYLLLRVKEGRNNLHTVKKKKANWIGYILRGNCLLKHVIGGKIKGIIEVREDKEEEVRSYWMASRKKKQDNGYRGCTRSYSVENSLRERLLACHKNE